MAFGDDFVLEPLQGEVRDVVRSRLPSDQLGDHLSDYRRRFEPVT